MEFLNVLSRSEMKNVMAGSMGVCPGSWCQCDAVYGCYYGMCGTLPGGQVHHCLDEVASLHTACTVACTAAKVAAQAQ